MPNVRLSFNGNLQDLSDAYIQLLSMLMENKTLNSDDLALLVARTHGLSIGF